jgi:hypothetical protein
MGFFKSHKTPPQPQPELSVHLSHPTDQVFQPNSTVSGHVTLTTPIPIFTQALFVSLWGNSSTWIRTSSTDSNNHTEYRHYRDNAPLFNVSLNVMPKSDQLFPDQTYTFPFNFQFPEGTGNNRSACYKKPDDERWTVLPHALPPTFISLSKWGRDAETPDVAEISYGVTARLVLPGIGTVDKTSDEPFSATQRINFQPTNQHALYPGPLSVVRYPKTFTLQSSSLASHEPSSISLRKRLHDRFSSATPKLDFEIALEIPDYLTSGAEFRFRASFVVVQKSDNVAHIPPIHFKIEKLELLDFTFFRAPRDWHASDTMAGLPKKYKHKVPEPGSRWELTQQDIYRENKTMLNAVPASQIVELVELGEKGEMGQAQQCEYWFTARVPGFTPPSFKSFAITRAYRVKVKLGVEIGEKRFPFETESFVRSLGGGSV